MSADAQTMPRPVTGSEATTYLLWAAVLLAVLGGLAAVAWYAAPETDWVSLGPAADYPPASTPYRVQAGERFYFVLNDGGGFLVLDPTSPHTLCQIKWVPMNGRFEDPYCGGKFTVQGAWIEGPARHGLFRFDAEVRDGVLWVNRWSRRPGPPAGTASG